LAELKGKALMTLLYVTEPGSYLTKDGNRLNIKKDRDSVIKSIGIDKLEGVVMVGPANMSTGVMTDLLERQIPVTWLSSSGRFFGRLEPTTGYNIERQIQQFNIQRDENFRLVLARSWVNAKILNCRTLLRRYNRNREILEVTDAIASLEIFAEKAASASSIESLMGFEGLSAKQYFQAVSKILPASFAFTGRSRRPPRDPFNSLISFGYTLVMYEIFTALTTKNLHPYLGFMHQPKRGHPALASDLMEEWRAVIVDSLAIGMLVGAELKNEDFEDPNEDGAVFLCRSGSKVFLEKFEKKLRALNQYLNFVDHPLTFRESLAFHVGALVRAIETEDPTVYRPIILR